MKYLAILAALALTSCGNLESGIGSKNQESNFSRHGNRDDKEHGDNYNSGQDDGHGRGHGRGRGRVHDDCKQNLLDDKHDSKRRDGTEHEDHGHGESRSDCTNRQGPGNAPAENPVDPTTEPTTTTAVTYADVEQIIRSACVKCHNPNGGASFLPLDTQARVEGAKSSMEEAISSGFMPLRNPGFKDSADGKKLLEYLRSGFTR